MADVSQAVPDVVLTPSNDSTEFLAPSLVGRVLGGRYDVLQLLGSGGMSSVYLCRHRSLNQMVAVKVLDLDKSTRQANLRRFELEARATFQLNHANLIKLIDYSVDENDLPFLVMEYVAGKTLSDVLIEEGRFDAKRFADIFGQVCDGLSYAHAHGILHRDLKPSNIMLTRTSDGKEEAKIVDFGIAKILEQEKNQQLTRTGDVFGSPLYMSPEQCKGLAVDHRSDLYALGCTMYECVSGEPPFRGDNPMRTMFMHVEQPVPPLKLDKSKFAQRAAGVEKIIFTLLEKVPAQRFQSASDLKEALTDCFGSTGSRSRLKLGKRGKILTSCVVALLLLLAIGSLCLLPKKGAQGAADKAGQTIAQTGQAEGKFGRKKEQDLFAIEEVKRLHAMSVRDGVARNYKKAAEELGEALNLSDGVVDANSVEMRTMLVEYGINLFFSNGDPVKIDEVFTKAENLFKLAPEVRTNDQGNIYGWHGQVCFNLLKFDQAYELVSRAQYFAELEPNQPSMVVNWLLLRAKILVRQKRIDQALTVYDTCERLAQKTQNKYPELYCDTFINKAEQLHSSGRLAEARIALVQARKIYNDHHLQPSSNEGITLDAMEKEFGVCAR